MNKEKELDAARIRDGILDKLRGEKKIFWREEANGRVESFKDVNFIKDIHDNPLVIENEINFLISDDAVIEGTASFVFLSKKGKAIIADLPNRGYVAKVKHEHYMLSIAEQTKDIGENTLSLTAINTTWVIIAAAASILTLVYEILK